MNTLDIINKLLDGNTFINSMAQECIDIKSQNVKDYEQLISGSYQRHHIKIEYPVNGVKVYIVPNYCAGKLGLAHFNPSNNKKHKDYSPNEE